MFSHQVDQHSILFHVYGSNLMYHICICQCPYTPTCTTLGAVTEVNEHVEPILSLCGGPSGSGEISLELLRYVPMHSYACVHTIEQEIFALNTTSPTSWICHWGCVFVWLSLLIVMVIVLFNIQLQRCKDSRDYVQARLSGMQRTSKAQWYALNLHPIVSWEICLSSTPT